MRLLVIGKGENQVAIASKIASDHGAKVAHCPDIDTALSQICEGNGADLILIDVTMSVKTLIDSLKNERIHIPVVGYGLNADSKQAVDAIKAGAKEYLPLPPDEELIAAILEAITDENSKMIFNSDAMKEIIKIADKVAPSDANVLITGQSGTGKEMLARYIHDKSKKRDNSFISVNCAAIPDNLLESELFGHEKGSFTGATQRRIGKFEESSGGTLLLDEISEMDLRLQAKLLRAIQEQEIDRVGGSKPIKIDLRVIATSNRDLQKEVAEGNFREDLLFRLNVIQLELPPLSSRKEDIPLFVDHFVKKYSKANGLDPIPVSSGAMAKLTSHSWPGNVRELENAIHRAVLLSSGDEIGEDSLLLNAGSSKSSESNAGGSSLVGRTVDNVEQELIENTLEHCLGNKTNAANILGISIRTLRNKLKQYEESGTRSN